MNNNEIVIYKEFDTVLPFSLVQQQRAIEIRNSIKDLIDMPKYLLAIEVNEFLRHVDNNIHLMLFETLWNTGARINEVLKLTPADFNFGLHTNNVRLLNSKRRRNNKKTNEDLVVKESYRLVPLTDPNYVVNIKRYLTTAKLKQNECIWGITERTALRWTDDVVYNAKTAGVTFSIPITPHTFRHSYAMHLLYAGFREGVVQKLLGHTNRKTTQIYLSILAIESLQDNVKFLYQT